MVKVSSCRAAIEASGGLLPFDLCSIISQQIEEATNATNDIGNSTAIFTIDWMKAGPPSFAPLNVFGYQVWG